MQATHVVVDIQFIQLLKKTEQTTHLLELRTNILLEQEVQVLVELQVKQPVIKKEQVTHLPDV